MIELLYGTYNPAKLAAMREWLSPLPVALVGLSELDDPPGDVEETGADPLENARIKAIAYRNATGQTTLAADSGLYLDGLAPQDQPGEHARRIAGRRLSDDEMIEHYAQLVRSMGGRVTAQYRNALCIACADGRLLECFDGSVDTASFYLVDVPHAKRTEGFPLDSLSIEIESGRYYYDLPSSRMTDGFFHSNGYARFVAAALGLSL